MSAVSTFISEYGYAAVFAGTILEGETVALVAGLAARHGYLDLGLVILTAALGGMLGDITMYFVGRRVGEPVLARLHKHQDAIDRVRALVQRHESLAIIGVRFAYGLRIAGPIVIGASGVRPARFVLFNAIGALLWASVVVGVGYGAGEVLHRYVAHHHHHALWFVVGLAGAAVAAFISHRVWRRRHA